MFVCERLAERRQVETTGSRAARATTRSPAITGVPRSTVQRWRRHPDARTARGRAVRRPWRPPDAAAYAYLLGALPRRRLPQPARVAAHDRARRPLPRHRRRPPRRRSRRRMPGIATRRYRPKENRDPRASRRARRWPRRVPSARTRPQAPATDRARRLAAGDHDRVTRASCCAGSSTRTAVAPSTASRRSCRADGSRRTSIRATSSRTCRTDIRRIFCEHCELLGIRWTQSNPRNISVSHRKSVALLDEFIGPKW